MDESAADGDRRLLGRVASGDRDALAELYARFGGIVFRYLLQLTNERGLAEEVLQDTLVGVWKGAGSFEGRSSVQTWLIGIARGRIADLRTAPGAGDPEESDVAAPGDLATDVVERQVLAGAVRRLDERDRELIALRYGADLTARQIAQHLDMQTNAVEVALHRALGRLRTLLGENST